MGKDSHARPSTKSKRFEARGRWSCCASEGATAPGLPHSKLRSSAADRDVTHVTPAAHGPRLVCLTPLTRQVSQSHHASKTRSYSIAFRRHDMHHSEGDFMRADSWSSAQTHSSRQDGSKPRLTMLSNASPARSHASSCHASMHACTQTHGHAVADPCVDLVQRLPLQLGEGEVHGGRDRALQRRGPHAEAHGLREREGGSRGSTPQDQKLTLDRRVRRSRGAY